MITCMSAYAQTTTVTYTATQKIDRFEEIQYFVGATAVQSHEFVIEGDAYTTEIPLYANYIQIKP